MLLNVSLFWRLNDWYSDVGQSATKHWCDVYGWRMGPYFHISLQPFFYWTRVDKKILINAKCWASAEVFKCLYSFPWRVLKYWFRDLLLLLDELVKKGIQSKKKHTSNISLKAQWIKMFLSRYGQQNNADVHFFLSVATLRLCFKIVGCATKL